MESYMDEAYLCRPGRRNTRCFFGPLSAGNRRARLLGGALLLCAISLVSAASYAQDSSTSYGQGFGVISLAPGQAQKVWIGATYQLLRVCNDLESKGTAVVVVDGQQPATLRPGICTEYYGNTIEIQNLSAGAATIVYRTVFEPPRQ